MAPRLEVADIFRAYGEAYQAAYGNQMPLRQKRAMRAIQICRTAALGGHIDICQDCGVQRNSYNSCRNRHCPKCQFLKTERWIQDRACDLLPTPYFHVVFTLPQDLRPLALRNQKLIYNLLFKAASQSLLELAREPKHLGAQIGITAVLHTWSQTLIDHPHLHCIVTGGGLSRDGHEWKAARGKRFLVPVKALSRLFRGKFLDFLKTHYREGDLVFPGQIAALETTFQHLLDRLYEMEWNVDIRPPLRSPERVVSYLGRYTHRIAISNCRLVSCEKDQVTFTYRDRRDGNRKKLLTVHVFEFIRRFLLHILPDRFVKIRHYGLLSNRWRAQKLAQCRRLLGVQPAPAASAKTGWQELLLQVAGIDVSVCPICGGPMRSAGKIAPGRAPPKSRKAVA